MEGGHFYASFRQKRANAMLKVGNDVHHGRGPMRVLPLYVA